MYLDRFESVNILRISLNKITFLVTMSPINNLDLLRSNCNSFPSRSQIYYFNPIIIPTKDNTSY